MGYKRLLEMVERLTSAQRSRVRKAYREAFPANDAGAAINGVFAKFVDPYGVSTTTLRQVVEEDQQRHPAEYTALQVLRQGQGNRRKRKSREGETFCRVCAQDLKISVGPLPTHTNSVGRQCKALAVGAFPNKWRVNVVSRRSES
jgi:hypothetical protein